MSPTCHVTLGRFPHTLGHTPEPPTMGPSPGGDASRIPTRVQWPPQKQVQSTVTFLGQAGRDDLTSESLSFSPGFELVSV